MSIEFADLITSEPELREILGQPARRNVRKVISVLDDHCRDFIARSPFMLLASADASGRLDVSPKGDPPGFVKILDEKTLAIPDRVGNNRADTLSNILERPRVGMLFMIPGKRETLRISGRARIVRDEWLRDEMAVRGRRPAIAIVVAVEEAFMHCAKCVIRSNLWSPEEWPEVDGLAPLARVLVDHASLTCSVDEMQEVVDESYRSRLY